MFGLVPAGKGDKAGVSVFALAMEPLAIAIRASPEVQGFKRRLGEEKVAMYVDDVLLF